ncbi:thiolase family protein [Sphingosinithalassobacter portus]|uniref:thiolase family protein n=1 Tax=Stakelama portus TaxID=2676234 RepID=UPI000D6E0396|nr:thiolase family protein [Sphingosinithalassobacter portus]
MAFLDGRTAIAGVGASRFERRPQASVLQFAATALDTALADAGLERGQVDGLISQVGSPRGLDYDTIAETLGLTPRYCSQTWAHGRFAATVLIEAAMAIHAGLATRVACIMAMKNSDIGRIGEANNPFFHEQFRENGGPHGEQGHIGMASPIAGAAMAFDLYCRRYAKDPDLLAAIPLTLRAHARLTDDAVMHKPMSREDYFAAPYMIEPLRLFDCSPVGDGAVCAIVTARNDRAGEVAITGAQGLRAGRDTFIFAPVGLGFGQQSTTRLTPEQVRGQHVYASAGVAPEAIDVLGAYDSFAPLPLYVLEDFGFCGAGEALDFVQDGRIGLNGAIPMNTSGGQLSQAQMNGWGQIRELVQQLRGQCGARQVRGAKRALWATAGGDALILEAN